MVYQLGGLITGEVGFNFFTIVAAVVLVGFIYLLVRPNKYAGDNEVKIDVSKITANNQLRLLKGCVLYDGIPRCKF